MTRAALLVAIAALYVVSVPWYRAADEPLRLWFGVPEWAAMAIVCYVAIACLNAAAWLLTDVPDREEDG